MKIYVQPFNLKQHNDLTKNKQIISIIGIKNFSTRVSLTEDFDYLKKYGLLSPQTAILLNKNFLDVELKTLENLLIELSKTKINSIIFCDFAIKQIVDENELKIKLIYRSETLTVNYDQLDFFQDNKLNSIVLSLELNIKEMIETIAKKKSMEILCETESFQYIMSSKWKLLDNFVSEEKINVNLTNKKLYLQENERKVPCLIFQDAEGTHLLSSYNYSLLLFLDKLILSDISGIIINSFLKSEQWVDKTIKLYLLTIDLIKNNLFSKNKAKLKHELNVINDNKVTTSFATGKHSDLIYLKGLKNE